MSFKYFQTAVQQQLALMRAHPLFKVQMDRDEVIENYLGAFSPGDNEVYRERAEHDCSCCKQFIRAAGGIVTLTPVGIQSIWDVILPKDGGKYQRVADAMSAFVKKHDITDAFLHYESTIGTHHNFELLEGKDQRRWDHFQINVPAEYVAEKDSIDTKLGHIRTNQDMLYRSIMDLDVEAVDTVLDLIKQKSLYRGEEHLEVVKRFRKVLVEVDKNLGQLSINQFCWIKAVKDTAVCRTKNSVIGTLIVDISEGVELEVAVKKFEDKVAPMNYKRTTALITPKMIELAQTKVEDLGIADSLYRRHAVTEDLTINNILFADRSLPKALHKDAFSDLKATAQAKAPKNLDKVQEIKIDDFIKDVLPTVDSMELMFDYKNKNNLMSLIAPLHPDAEPIFKWGNNFSWSYAGEVTDSIVERVKAAGGSVTGDLRFSLSWFNTDDYDLWVQEPGGNKIGFSSKQNRATGGQLDVDMNVSAPVTDAVENITWAKKEKLLEGKYKVWVNNYTQRNQTNYGFTVEMEFCGVKTQYHHNEIIKGNKNVTVVEFDYSHDKGIKIIKGIANTAQSEDIWGIQTQQFSKVSMVMNSPNHWDGEKTGNKHYFFVLDNCLSDEPARGFFNEFLDGKLTEHRKVFEVLGSKTKVPDSDTQLSGLGFSSTKPDSVLCRLAGSFNRTIKIVF